MIRAVLDTNVLTSGLAAFSSPASAPARVLHAWRDCRFELVLSEFILVELARVLKYPYFSRRISPKQVTTVLALLKSQGRMVHLTGRVRQVATHPEDDLIMATALSGGADYLVTGDRGLQQLENYRKSCVKSPSSGTFLRLPESPGLAGSRPRTDGS